MLLDNTALDRALELVRPDDFYREAHRKIMRAIIELSERGEPIDLITLADALKARGELQDVGGSAALPRRAGRARYPPRPTSPTTPGSCAKSAILRSLIQTATEIATRGYECAGRHRRLSRPGRAQDLRDLRTQGPTPVSSASARSWWTPCRPSSSSTSARSWSPAYPPASQELDEMTAGLQPSDLVIIAGRPSMGKTAFALNIAAARGHARQRRRGRVLARDVEGAAGAAHAVLRGARRPVEGARRLSPPTAICPSWRSPPAAWPMRRSTSTTRRRSACSSCAPSARRLMREPQSQARARSSSTTFSSCAAAATATRTASRRSPASRARSRRWPRS